MTIVNPPENPKKSTTAYIGYVAGGLVIGTLLVFVLSKPFSKAAKKVCHSLLQEETAKKGRGGGVVSVEAVVTSLGTMTKRVNTVGKLRANESVTIKSEISGVIREIHFREGADVKKGDLLISFKDDEILAELHQAEAETIEAQAAFDRNTMLKDRGAGTGKAFDEAKAKLAVAKAHVEKANAKLMGTKIYAPFEGRIGLIEQSPGAFVQVNTDLVTLVDSDPMKLDFRIPEKYLLEIGVGQSAEVKIDTLPEEKFIATVDAIDSKVDTASHSVAVRASIPNKEGRLKVGQFSNISLIVGEKGDALIVPDSAVGREGDREFVWVIINGKSTRAPIISGTRENDRVEIISGLREGFMVVTTGQVNLSDGAPVKILNMTEEEIASVDKKLMDKLAKAKKKQGAQADDEKDSEKPLEEETKPQETKPQETQPEEGKETQPAPSSEPVLPEADQPKPTPSEKPEEAIVPVTPDSEKSAEVGVEGVPLSSSPQPAESSAPAEAPKEASTPSPEAGEVEATTPKDSIEEGAASPLPVTPSENKG